MAIYKDKNKTKDGRSWFYKVYKKDFEGISVPYKSKRYLTKKECEEAEALFLLKRDNPTKKFFSIIANDYFESLKKTNKMSTCENYKQAYYKHIKDYFEKKYINDINNYDIKIWKELIDKQNYKTAYKRKLFNVLRNILDFAVTNYSLPFNPAQRVGNFKEKNDKIIKDEEKTRYITYKQFEKFISVIDNPLWKTFFMFLYYTGCRKGEAMALKWNDIDFEKNILSINKTLYSKIKGDFSVTSTKNNLNRKIQLSNVLKEQLILYKKEQMRYADFEEKWYVFGGTRYLSTTSIDRYKNYYFKLSGITPITIHEFRHSHVSLLINEYIKASKEKNMKVDMAKFFLMMSNRLGHSVEVMQRTYMHLIPTVQDEIVDLLNNLEK